MKISERIKERLDYSFESVDSSKSYLANDSIYDVLQDGDIDGLIEEVADSFQGVLDSLVIDSQKDHNTKD